MLKSMTKKIRFRSMTALAILIAAALTLTGCQPLIPADTEEVAVYATFYPIYALSSAVMEGIPNLSLRCLIQPQDGCLRSYKLSDWDMRLLSSARAVIMGGRGLESFEGTLFGIGEAGPAMVAALYNLELYNASTSHESDEGASHLSGSNPHLYMSPDGAKQMIESIAASMLELDPEFSDAYAQNVARAEARLDDLWAQMQAVAGDVAGNPVVLMNEALIYVVQDYGLKIADWVDRESGSALYDDALSKCIDRLKGTEARVILIERQAPQSFVAALEDAGFAVARIDILSTHRENEGFDGYLQAQLENAGALRNAFDAAAGAEQEDQT